MEAVPGAAAGGLLDAEDLLPAGGGDHEAPEGLVHQAEVRRTMDQAPGRQAPDGPPVLRVTTLIAKGRAR